MALARRAISRVWLRSSSRTSRSGRLRRRSIPDAEVREEEGEGGGGGGAFFPRGLTPFVYPTRDRPPAAALRRLPARWTRRHAPRNSSRRAEDRDNSRN